MNANPARPPASSRMAIAATPPSGRLKALLHLPVALNRRGLGRLFGQRLLIIEHQGRRTGRRYETPVEVVAHDRIPSWTVTAAWGGRPQWLTNIEATGATAVTVAGRRYPAPTQRRLEPDEAYDVLVAYVCSHPFAARGLFRVLAWPDPRTPGALRRVSQTTTLINFTPSP